MNEFGARHFHKKRNSLVICNLSPLAVQEDHHGFISELSDSSETESKSESNSSQHPCLTQEKLVAAIIRRWKNMNNVKNIES